MADELRDEPRVRSGMARLLGVEGGGRPALTAFVVGLAGTAAFVASLVLDWQRMTVPDSSVFVIGGTFLIGLEAAGFGAAYLVGMLGCLTMLGLVLTRSELARRARLGAAALGVGLVGVLIAVVDQLQDTRAQYFGYNFAFPGGMPPELQQLMDDTTFAPLPGQLLAFGAVALLVAAIWLAGGPARANQGDATPVSATPGYPVAGTPSAAPVSPADAPQVVAATPADPSGQPLDPPTADGPTRVGYVDGLTVVASDAIDLGNHADILRD